MMNRLGGFVHSRWADNADPAGAGPGQHMAVPPGARLARAMMGRRFVKASGAIILALNLAVIGLSLSDMYIMGTGAIRVGLPTERDFNWRFDSNRSTLVFESNYTVENGGFYDITGLDIRAAVTTQSGVMLVNFTKRALSIPSFSQACNRIVIDLPIDRLLAIDFGSMLFSANYFQIDVEVSADYLFGLARFYSTNSIGYIWKPPLKDYASLFSPGIITSLFNETLQSLGPDQASLPSWVATAILAAGNNITISTESLDILLRYSDGWLDMTMQSRGDPADVIYSNHVFIEGKGISYG